MLWQLGHVARNPREMSAEPDKTGTRNVNIKTSI